MRIAELSSRSGASIPTIKYYLREGLLPAGTPTGRNQADYADEHLRRLQLVRALIDVGGLSVAAARDVLDAVDRAGLPSHELLGAAHYALDPAPRRDRDDPGWRSARAEIETEVRQRGWHVDERSPNLDRAADAVAAMRGLEQGDLLECLPTYFSAADQVARHEVAAVVRRGDPARMVEGVVTGTILGETILAAVRRLAQENVSAEILGGDPT